MDLQVHTSHGGEAAAEEMVEQRHINHTKMMPQPMPLEEMEEPWWQYTASFISSLRQYNESCAAAVAPKAAAAGGSLSDDEGNIAINYDDDVDQLLADAGVEAFGPVLAEL
jgi:hypothetical protein